MKRFIRSFLLFVSLLGTPGYVYADSLNLSSQSLGVQLAAEALKNCMAQYLDTQQIQDLESKVNRAIKRVEAYCRHKNEQHAYQAVQHYSKQPEAIAAITCARQLRPLLQEPSIQQLIGKHQNDVNTVLAGEIPTPICR